MLRTVFGLLLLTVLPAQAMSARRLSLATMAHDAGCVVHGTVAEVRVDRDEAGMPATWVTLDVHRTIKAPQTPHMTFKQTGTSTPLADGMMLVTGLPTYAVGDEVVLFLYQPSAHGYTSPLGMGQGYFRVERSGGHATVSTEDGRRDLDEFLTAVTTLAGSPP